MKRLLLSFLLCLALAAGASAAGIDALFISCSVTADGAAEYSMAVSCRFDTQEKSITLPLAGERPSGVTLSGADWSLDSSGGWSRVVAKSSDGFVGRQTFVVSWRAALPAIDAPLLLVTGKVERHDPQPGSVDTSNPREARGVAPIVHLLVESAERLKLPGPKLAHSSRDFH